MKQKIAVRAIIRQDQKTLLGRRASGRKSIIGKYELPGGKVGYREQPEDAIRRYLQNDLGAKVQTAQLYDVVTYIDRDDRNVQYLLIVYLVGLKSPKGQLRISENYDDIIWQKMSGLRRLDITESSRLLLKITSDENTTHPGPFLAVNNVDDKATASTHAVLYSDGGSRGNPGPSAAGFVIMNSEREVIEEGGVYLGITTNNQAEYHGVRIGLERALELGFRTIDFRIDSMLVVNQMNGLYQIKNRDLWPINERIKQLVREFDKVTFKHVKREFNQLADGMVNKTLDSHQNNELMTKQR